MDQILINQEDILGLNALTQSLQRCVSCREKEIVLASQPQVTAYLSAHPEVAQALQGCSCEDRVCLFSLMAIGQAEHLLSPFQPERLCSFLDPLRHVEAFYSSLGGIVGYHATIQRLLASGEKDRSLQGAIYHAPEGVDLALDSIEVREAVLAGIARLGQMAEIYPVGGAADRLRLQDEKTGVALSAAMLPLGADTLLERLIVDLQAREYVHYKLFGEQVVTPLALMTSHEKENHAHVVALLERQGWFGRGAEAFRLFCQPSVPTVDQNGRWISVGAMQLLLKPGGHGVIWKLAREEGVFDWLFAQGKRKALIRQINNPISGVDHGLLAFSGLGLLGDKAFGFSSCLRQVGSSEGMNVLVQQGSSYVLRNIEYCDFQRYAIADVPVREGSLYSKYPSNTNILFVDLQAVERAVEICPIPGMLVNLKKIAYFDAEGNPCETGVARLESTMQNIADVFKAEDISTLPSFLTYNTRRKTISCAKREFALGRSFLETPEGCFLDMLHNGRELLEGHCGMWLPPANDFLFFYHPALGPLYTLIGQKIRGGRMAPCSELHLEIAELDMEGIDLEGSMIVEADAPMGYRDSTGRLLFSETSGKCVLKNVVVRNRGIDQTAPNVFWKKAIQRHELCHIRIHGDGEFYAEGVTLCGNLDIDVAAGMRITATEEQGRLTLRQEPLVRGSSWSWHYFIGPENRILISKK